MPYSWSENGMTRQFSCASSVEMSRNIPFLSTGFLRENFPVGGVPNGPLVSALAEWQAGHWSLATGAGLGLPAKLAPRAAALRMPPASLGHRRAPRPQLCTLPALCQTEGPRLWKWVSDVFPVQFSARRGGVSIGTEQRDILPAAAPSGALPSMPSARLDFGSSILPAVTGCTDGTMNEAPHELQVFVFRRRRRGSCPGREKSLCMFGGGLSPSGGLLKNARLPGPGKFSGGPARGLHREKKEILSVLSETTEVPPAQPLPGDYQDHLIKHQLQAYVAWVNSQLKKRPAIEPVRDLRLDLRDGVVLASLVEIVAGEKLSGVQVSPTSQQEMRENVEKVLQFVASKKIRMHQTSAKERAEPGLGLALGRSPMSFATHSSALGTLFRSLAAAHSSSSCAGSQASNLRLGFDLCSVLDIVDGNLKSTMRLILALAAHFKPGSSKAASQTPSGAAGKSPAGAAQAAASHRPHSATAVAQGAVAALADVRQDVSRSGRDVFRHRQRDGSLDEEIEHPYWSVRALVQQYEGQQSVPSESHSSSGRCLLAVFLSKSHQEYFTVPQKAAQCANLQNFQAHELQVDLAWRVDLICPEIAWKRSRVFCRAVNTILPSLQLEALLSIPLGGVDISLLFLGQRVSFFIDVECYFCGVTLAFFLPLARSLASPSPIHSAQSECSATPSEEKVGFDIVREEEAEIRTEATSSPFPLEWQARCPAASLETSWEEQLLEQQDYLEKEMEEAKKMISGLQALLLNGSLPEDEQERSYALCEQEACPEEQLVIIRSRLDQSMEENQELKKGLQKHKQEARNLQGVKDALQQRLTQQDTLILQIKQELLRANMDKEELHSQNADLQRKVEERNRLLAEYKKELGQKDRLLHQHQSKMEEMLQQLSEASYQQADLERELEHREALLAQCMKKDAEEVRRREPLTVSVLLPSAPQVIAYSNHGAQSNGFVQMSGKGATSTAHRGTNDLQLVREALRSLRNSFSGHDPQHHTIDSLEQGISSLMERLHRMEVQKRQERRVRGKSPASHATNEYQDSWPPNSKLPHSHSTPVVSSSACTKVLYFTDRSLTPFMVNIPKRLGEVTLRDFKAAIDREGTHRYHFKALDPEFGTVKEEVSTWS
ncbi:hypothetical protein lerEdw1_007621 [Lerista edwardsae]|nr:hypothetical protein lerEdw1_007621 [Lerista edwardsae]